MTPHFYFRPGVPIVDWEDPSTVVMANPAWMRRAGAELEDAARQLPDLQAHVWVATSGTSRQAGRLRWVALSKQAMLASARAVNEHLQAAASDVWAHALPVFHVGGLGILARAHLSRARIAAAVEDRWDPVAYRNAVVASGATLSALVPSQIHDLVVAGVDSPPTLRAIVVGGARLEPVLLRRARERGWPCLPSYGLTETGSQVATAPLASLDGATCPSALPMLGHAEIRAGEDGRLSVRALSLLTCYAETGEGGPRVWDPKRDGWFETDDLGRVDGRLVEVLGRASDTVKVLGELVSLPAVEERARVWADGEGLRSGPGFDLAAVALPHDRLGHELVLAMTAVEMSGDRRARLEASLAAFSRQALLPYERIQRIAWVDAIPRTALGKVRRQLLGDLVAKTSRPPTSNPPAAA
jgi:O-succinylbenzoic acid--CoA ligase